MREIKFRGRRTLNGEWVYGNLMIKQADSPVPETSESCKCYYIVPIDGLDYYEHEVDPSTIGQYTGLKDSNGKEIYEGDIISSGATTGIVMYDCEQAGFITQKEKAIELRFYSLLGIKVIGNIHDNPELLEEGGER